MSTLNDLYPHSEIIYYQVLYFYIQYQRRNIPAADQEQVDVLVANILADYPKIDIVVHNPMLSGNGLGNEVQSNVFNILDAINANNLQYTIPQITRKYPQILIALYKILERYDDEKFTILDNAINQHWSL